MDQKQLTNVSSNASPWNLKNHRAVWALAAPLMLSNVAAPLLALVDTAVIGRLPEPHYLGAVAVGGMIMTIVAWSFSFLRVGTGGLTAQAAGAKDSAELAAVLVRGLGLAAVFATIILLLQVPLLHLALFLVEGSEEVERLTATYFLTRIWGVPAALANYVLVGWFLGTRNPVMTLIVQLVLNGLNAALSLWFVLGLKLDVFGVALASAIAEYAALAVGLVFAWRVGAGHWHALRLDIVARWDRFKRLMTLNANIFLRTIMMLAAFSYFTAQGAKQGDVILAANTVLMQFFMFIGLAMDAFADAAEVQVGQTFGASDSPGFHTAVVISGFWSIVAAVGFALAYGLAGGFIIDGLTTLEEVRETARLYLPWAVFLPIAAALAFSFDGVYFGATRADLLRNAVAISAIGYFLAVWFFMDQWGNHGLWAALIVFMLLRTVTLGVSLPKLYASVAIGRPN